MTTARTKLICHRGHHATCPENSMDAFQRAAESGADGIETDVRLAADGQLVLFHDRSVPDGHEVKELTKAQLSAVAGHNVPTLEEALDAWPDLWWNVEIKSRDAAALTFDVLKRVSRQTELLLISFWHDVILDAKTHLEIELGLTISHGPTDIRSVMPHNAETQPNTIVWNYEFLDPRLVHWAHDHGLRCLAYNLLTSDDHHACQELGLAGVITDFPHMLVAEGKQ